MANRFYNKHPYLTTLMVIVAFLLAADFISDRFGDGRHHGDGWRHYGHHAANYHHRKGCRGGMERWVESRVFMGRSDSGGSLVVSETDWQQFLETEIRKRFPRGFTILDATGYWGAGEGESFSEPTKILVLLHDGSEFEKLGEVGAVYMERFNLSVIRQDSPACIRFMQ